MANKATIDELWGHLRPFIKEHAFKKDTVTEDDVNMLIHFAESFHVEDALLVHVKEHPDAAFWDYLEMVNKDIPEGQFVPIGQEDILDDIDDDEDD